MNNRIVGKWLLGISLVAALPFAGGCVQEAGSSAQAGTIASNTVVSTNLLPVEAAAVSTNEATATTNEVEALPEIDIAEAPYKPVPTERVVPPGVRTNGPLGEILRMADAGVEEGVLLAFVTNSTTVFGLDADEVIYLNDIGIPSSVVTAMLQNDQALKEAGAPAETAEAAVTAQPNAPAETNDTALTPSEIAPQSPETATAQQPPAPSAAAPQPAPAPAPQVTYQTFYDTLAPYGNWVYIEGYGRVWQPTVVVVNPDWTPYVYGGRWLYTDAGWYWMSDYSWGWAPFHYGRWFRHYRLGWCWYPDTVWGPSWVTWRYNDGYCGWAPLPPGAWYRPGFGLTWWGNHVSVGFTFGLGYSSFTFVNWGHFHGHHHLHRYSVPHHRRHSIYRETVVATRIEGNRHHAANRGLPVQRVATATGTPIRPVAIREANLAGRTRGERLGPNGRELTVYRPRLADGNRTPTGRTPTELGQTGSANRGTTTRSIAANRFAGRSTPGTMPSSQGKSWERPVSAARSAEGRQPATRTASNQAQAATRTQRAEAGSLSERLAANRNDAASGGRTLINRSPSETRDVRSAFADRSLASRNLASRTPTGPAATPARPSPSAQSANTPSVQPNRQPSVATQTQPGGATTPAAPTTTWQRGTPNGRQISPTVPNTSSQARSSAGNQAVTRDWRAQAPQSGWQRGATPAPAAPSTPSARPAPTYQRPQATAPVTTPRSAPSVTPMPRRESLNGSAPGSVAPQRSTVPSYNRAPDVPRYTPPAPSVPQRSMPSYQSQPRVQPSYQAPAAPSRTYSAPAPAPTRSYSAPSYSAPAQRAPQATPAPSAPSRGGGGWNRGGGSERGGSDRGGR